MSSLLVHAAQSAAQADGLTPNNATPVPPATSQPAQGKKKGQQLRRGKWTPEEEAYANRLIQEFKAGLLPLTDGTTLRTFLSKLLNCDPMRISKKFVGSNCIGKQVFRRRSTDLNRLTPEQIAQNRVELSELERRFLERVAQTNRVKSSGVGGGTAVSSVDSGHAPSLPHSSAPNSRNPAWMQPPLGYRQGTGAVFAATNQTGANSRVAAAGRALLGDLNSKSPNLISKNGGANTLAMAELQRRVSQSGLYRNSEGNLFSAIQPGVNTSLSSTAIAQLAQRASASHLTGIGAENSINNFMIKTGLSRDQLSQLARNQGLSNSSLSNMVQRQNSFDALMSLDMQQSFQSIDNLANLIQNQQPSLPEGGMQNANFDFGSRNLNLRENDVPNAARHLASSGQLGSLLGSIPGSNAGNREMSHTNLSRMVLQEGASNSNIASLLTGQNQSVASFANLLQHESGTGLSALRMQDGQRNTSVDDFLNLMATGEIPHQDASVLNVSLVQQQQDTAQFLAQQAQNNPSLANALAARQASSRINHAGGTTPSKRRIGEVSGSVESNGGATSKKK